MKMPPLDTHDWRQMGQSIKIQHLNSRRRIWAFLSLFLSLSFSVSVSVFTFKLDQYESVVLYEIIIKNLKQTPLFLCLCLLCTWLGDYKEKKPSEKVWKHSGFFDLSISPNFNAVNAPKRLQKLLLLLAISFSLLSNWLWQILGGFRLVFAQIISSLRWDQTSILKPAMQIMMSSFSVISPPSSSSSL